MPSDFVTEAQMLKHVDSVRDDLKDKIDIVDDKVDELKSLVLPLVESSKATAENTKAMRDSLSDLTDVNNSQNVTLARHSLEIETVKNNRSQITSVIVAILGVIGIIITAIIK